MDDKPMKMVQVDYDEPDGFLIADLGYDLDGRRVLISTHNIRCSDMPREFSGENVGQFVADAINHYYTHLKRNKKGQ